MFVTNKTRLAYMHDKPVILFNVPAASSQRSLRAKPRDIYKTNAGLSSDKDMNKNE